MKKYLPKWQLISDDKVWMFPAEVRLSTVAVHPELATLLGYEYETCVFYLNRRDNEILDRYHTVEDAIRGHEKYETQFNLKRCTK